MKLKSILIIARGILSPWILYAIAWSPKILGFNVDAKQLHLVFLFCLYFMLGLIAIGFVVFVLRVLHRANCKR